MKSKIKNQEYTDVFYSSSSLKEEILAELGTVEADASGFYGLHEKEEFRGKRILDELIKNYEFKTVLDIGGGLCHQSDYLRQHGKIVEIIDLGINNINSTKKSKYDYIGNFLDIDFKKKYDVVLVSHVLEHQVDINRFLRKVSDVASEEGYIYVVVPPRKPFLIGGHYSLWNMGLLIYNMIVAGIDCSRDIFGIQYDYNIGVIVKNNKFNIDKLNLSHDRGDIDRLKDYFPFAARDGINGDIFLIDKRKRKNEHKNFYS